MENIFIIGIRCDYNFSGDLVART